MIYFFVVLFFVCLFWENKEKKWQANWLIINFFGYVFIFKGTYSLQKKQTKKQQQKELHFSVVVPLVVEWQWWSTVLTVQMLLWKFPSGVTMGFISSRNPSVGCQGQCAKHRSLTNCSVAIRAGIVNSDISSASFVWCSHTRAQHCTKGQESVLMLSLEITTLVSLWQIRTSKNMQRKSP